MTVGFGSPAAMSVSLSEFFCVAVEPHELKRCLDYTSSECKLAAWYGDALLAMFVSQRIFEEDPHNIGTMTRKKAHYVSNLTMKEFLLGHTDASSRLTDAASMSVHSFGTVFEALLELCHKKSGAVGFTNFSTIDPYRLESKEKMNTMIVEGLQSWLGEEKLAKAEEARVKAAKVAKAVVSTRESRWGPIPWPTTTEHINNEITTAAWRSNSKNWYNDRYYHCCGVRDGVLTCLRPLWIDAADSCHHPGTLDIPDKKAEFQYGESQFGRVTGVPNPSTRYTTKIGQWLKDYEHVVKEESSKPVGADGVVQNKRRRSLWDDLP
eukprot:gene8194-9753_t